MSNEIFPLLCESDDGGRLEGPDSRAPQPGSLLGDADLRTPCSIDLQFCPRTWKPGRAQPSPLVCCGSHSLSPGRWD